MAVQVAPPMRGMHIVARMAQCVLPLLFLATERDMLTPVGIVLHSLTLLSAVYAVLLPSNGVLHAGVGVALDAVACLGWLCATVLLGLSTFVACTGMGCAIGRVLMGISGVQWLFQLVTLRESGLRLEQARATERAESLDEAHVEVVYHDVKA